MSDSSQVKEVVLEVGEQTAVQEYTIQVENGSVVKTVFDACANNCTDDVLNANDNLEPNWNNWHRMSCTNIRQIGDSPGVWSGPGQPPPQMTNFGVLDIIYDGIFNGAFGDSNLIVFTLNTDLGGDPQFNGLAYSESQSDISVVNNMRSDGRADTEQGRMLYLVPRSTAPSAFIHNISFEILEGRGHELLVRGAGGKSIGEFLHENGYDFVPIEEINGDSGTFWTHFEFTISPYIHSAKWQYDNNGDVVYDSSRQAIHASYVGTPTGQQVTNCISNAQDAFFGVRSTDSLFYGGESPCFDNPMDGFKLTMNVDLLENAVIEVLTYTPVPGEQQAYEFALEYEGVVQTGFNWVWKKIETTGIHSICVPFHYNVAELQEGGGGAFYGISAWPTGFTTGIRVQTGGGGFVSGQYLDKVYYSDQYKFIRIQPTTQDSAARVRIGKFAITNSYLTTKEIDVPTYTDRVVKVPAYDYKVLDIYDRDKVPLALSFTSGDLSDPSKRSTGYSKTFELPANNRNQRILKTMTADGSNRQVADISWRKARIKANGITVFSGFARIEKSITGQGGRYSCHILQDPSYWPELIGDKKLSELSFPDHTKSYQTVVDSWSKTVDDIPYVYPAINYGKWTKDSQENITAHTIADFHPATYVYALVQKIFEDIGYTINSNFINTKFFKKLIIPYTSNSDYNTNQTEGNDGLGEDGNYSLLARRSNPNTLPDIDATNFGSTNFESYYPVLSFVEGLEENYEMNTSYVSNQNGFTIPFTGRWCIDFTARMKVKATGILCGNNNPGKWAAWLLVNGLAPMPDGGWANPANLGEVYVFSTGDGTQEDCGTGNTNAGPGNLEGTQAFCVRENCSNNDYTTRVFSCKIDLQAGDLVQVGYFGRNAKDLCGLEATTKEQELFIFPDTVQAFVPPAEVSLNTSLGDKYKQIDFLKGITEMFNLYWTADNDTKVVSVEPYDDFFGSGEVIDWTQKIDRKSWTDKFLIEELAKTVRYKYKVDSSDDLVRESNLEQERELWSLDITFDQLYRKTIKELGSTIFSPTHRILSDGGGDAFFPALPFDTWPVMPCMWNGNDVQTNWFGDNNISGTLADLTLFINQGERPDYSTNFNIRILNWGGLSDKTGAWYLTNDQGEPETHYTYPYAYTFNYNHAGEPGTIEDSLAWKSFAGAIGTTQSDISQYQRGLFDRYYGRLFEKINGGAALRTCMINLTASDIAKFDFRNIIKIVMDGGVETFWTVNSIKDYQPGKDALTKVELIEWKIGFKRGKGGKTNYGGIRPNDINGGKGEFVGDNGEVTIYPDGGFVFPNETPALSDTVKITNNVTAESIRMKSKLPPLKPKEIQTNVVEDTTEFVKGESISADITTKDFTMTADIYYQDLDGVRQKICLKEIKGMQKQDTEDKGSTGNYNR